jgi:hypothetical protein
LQGGLHLHVGSLIRRGLFELGKATGILQWSNASTGETVASAYISAGVESPNRGWLRIQVGQLDQRITLTREPRHFGGGQWYFECPQSWRRCLVLWKPPGANYFACRQRWGRQVAYSSQFATASDRADRGRNRIYRRLGVPHWGEGDESEYPPKPKWMRSRIYNGLLAKIDHYDHIQNECFITAAHRILARS